MLASGHECVTADITAGRCWLRTAVRISGIFGLATRAYMSETLPMQMSNLSPHNRIPTHMQHGGTPSRSRSLFHPLPHASNPVIHDHSRYACAIRVPLCGHSNEELN